VSDSKVEKPAGRPKPPNAGKGRPAGSLNKVTGELKEMILNALDGAGGVEYLQRQADENPNAFLSLVGKVLPLTVKHQGGLTLTVSTGIDRDGD